MIEYNRIYAEDCLITTSRIQDDSIDLIVCSPPYDNLRKYKGYTFDFEKIAKDLYRILKDRRILVWITSDATIRGSETGTSFRQALFFKDVCGFNLHDTMIFEKTSLPQNQHPRYSPTFEYMFVFCKGYPPEVFHPIETETVYSGKSKKSQGQRKTNDEKRHADYKNIIVKSTKRLTNVWRIPTGNNLSTRDKIAFLHPAIFPEEVARRHIVTWSNPGDLVYDPFMGSGTTAKMAMLNGRNYIGSEISEEYCRTAEERIRNYGTID